MSIDSENIFDLRVPKLLDKSLWSSLIPKALALILKTFLRLSQGITLSIRKH